MQEVWAYDEGDQELSLAATVQLRNIRIDVSAGTVASSPDRPNEDAFAVLQDNNDNGALVAAVFDGTTNLRPIPALGAQTGARFASHFLKDRLASCPDSAELRETMLRLNTALLEASQPLGGSLEDPHTLPSSTATIVRIEPDTASLSFAHVSDTFGIAYYEDGRSEVFTEDTNERFDQKVFALIADIAKSRRITPREARHDSRVKDLLIQMAQTKNNHPNGEGSGIVNGHPHMEQYVQTGRLALRGVDAVLLGTDGLVPPGWSLEHKADRQEMLAAISTGGLRRLFALKHQAEDADPDWHHVRYKHSDDATGVLVQLPRT